MTLRAAVELRVSEELLTSLTRQDQRGTGLAPDTDVLDAACADAIAEFAIETALTFDSSNSQHVWAGVKGALYYLHVYSATQKEVLSRLRTDWENALNKIARSLGAERRIMPRSSSVAQPSQRQSGFMPDDDRVRWNDMSPRPPRGRDSGDETWRH